MQQRTERIAVRSWAQATACVPALVSRDSSRLAADCVLASIPILQQWLAIASLANWSDCGRGCSWRRQTTRAAWVTVVRQVRTRNSGA